jgi:hypothetical protein
MGLGGAVKLFGIVKRKLMFDVFILQIVVSILNNEVFKARKIIPYLNS